MKQIQKILDIINQFDYVVKIAKAALAGYDAFNKELQNQLGNGEKQR